VILVAALTFELRRLKSSTDCTDFHRFRPESWPCQRGHSESGAPKERGSRAQSKNPATLPATPTPFPSSLATEMKDPVERLEARPTESLRHSPCTLSDTDSKVGWTGRV